MQLLDERIGHVGRLAGRRRQQPGRPDRQQPEREAHPVQQGLRTDLDRSRADHRRADLLGGEEDIERADRDRQEPERPRATDEGRHGDATERQRSEKGGEDDERRHSVDRREEGDHQDERRSQLRDGVRTRQWRGRIGNDRGEQPHQPAGRDSEKVRSASARAKARSWVTKHTPLPESRSAASNPRSSPHVRRSWPNVGSSRTMSAGAVARAVATERRRFSPPDRVYGFAAASRPRWRRSSSSSARRSADRASRPIRLGPSSSSSRTDPVRNWCSGSWKTVPTCRARSRAGHRARSSRP